MTKSGGWWHTDILALFPAHGICTPNHKVVTTGIFWLMFFFVTRSFGPASEHNYVGATDVHSMVKAMLRWGATDPKSAPNKSFCV